MTPQPLFTPLAAMLAAALLSLAPASHAADKVSIMVGGYEKIIYLPAKLTERLDPIAQDPEAVMRYGIEYATQQCRDCLCDQPS